MARNAKNKFPADKTGTKYSEFRNTKRVAPGKVRAAATPAKPGSEAAPQASDKQTA